MVKFQCEHEEDFWKDTFLSLLNSGARTQASSVENLVAFADESLLALRERSSVHDGELEHGHEHEPDKRPS